MGESIWVNIKVKVPNTWNRPDQPSPWLVDNAMISTPPLFMEAFNLGNGEGPDVYDDSGLDWTIWSVSGEGNYGLLDDDVAAMLERLREHWVPFEATEDAKYEWLGQYVWNNGFEEHSSEYAGESLVLPEATYRGWAAETGSCEMDRLLALAAKIEAFFNVGDPPLSEVSIEHLPAINPIDEPEEDE